MNEIKQILDIANAEVGYLEKSKNAYLKDPTILYDKVKGAGSDNYTKFAKEMDDLNVYNSKKQGYAWCNIFIDWCFVQSVGLDRARELLIGFSAGCTQDWNWLKSAGRIVTNPQRGDLIFFKNLAHIGIIEKVENGKIYTIEGNTSNAAELIMNGGEVAKKEYNIGSSVIYGYARPNYEGQKEEILMENKPKNDIIETVEVQVNSLLRIRAGAGTNYSKIGEYHNGDKVNIYEIKGNWGRTDKGWICLDYTKVVKNNTTTNYIPSNYVLGLYQVNTPSGLNVRAGAGTNYSIIKTYANGTRFDTYEIKNNWARTPSGWVCLDYCKLIKKY